MLKEECFPIGILQKPYGVKGKVIIRFYKQLSEKYKNLESVFIEIDKQPVPFFIQEYTVRDKNSAIVKLEELDTEEKTKESLNNRIMILKKDIEEPLEKEEHKYISYQLYDINENYIGNVRDIIDYSTHSVFQIFHEKKEILIPANEKLIVRIDNDSKTIIIDVPEGLLDIYL